MTTNTNLLTFEKMSKHYETLLESGILSDVVLVAGGKELRVHKQVLSARSPVFAAMFTNELTKEAQQNRVDIIDVDVEVLELLVRYIYTGKIGTVQLFENAADLLIAADKYQFECLKTICERQLLCQVTTETAPNLLILADMYHATELTAKCLDYITDNSAQVIASKAWKEKIVARTDLVVKICELLSAKYTKLMDGEREKKMIKLDGRLFELELDDDGIEELRPIRIQIDDDEDDNEDEWIWHL